VCRSAQLTVAQASLTVLQDHDQAVWFLRDSPEFQRSQDAVICIEPGVRADLPRRVLDYFLSGIPDGVQVPASLHLDGREVFPVRGRTFGRQPESPEIAAFEAAMQEITRPCAVVPVAAEAQLRKQIAELEADNAALSQKLENAKREVLRRMPVKIVVDLSTESGMGSKRSREE
jgi:hypothetical protein